MKPICVRHGVASDAPELAAFAARTFSETFAAENRPEDMQVHLASSYGVPQQTKELADPNVATLLAHQDDTLVAYAQVRRKSPPPCVRQAQPIELHRFYVDRHAQGSGVAKALMSAVYGAAQEFGGRHLWLSVWERNPRAMAFYAKVGFADVGATAFYVGADRQTDRVLVAVVPPADHDATPPPQRADKGAEPAVELHPVESPTQRTAARELIGEYLRWVAEVARSNYGLSFDVEAMVQSDIEDRDKFYPPNGRIYLVRHQAAYAGVGCLKRLAPGLGEVQRMYVRPDVRGVGAGRLLVHRLLEDAEELGYTRVRLESLKALTAAHRLYRSVGFREIDPYSENSMRDYQPPDSLAAYRNSAVFMELTLGSHD